MGFKNRQTKERIAAKWGFKEGIENTIQIKHNRDMSMAHIFVNDNNVYSGNYWDFRPEVHGLYDIGRFNSAGGLAVLLLKICNDAEWDCVFLETKDLTWDEAMALS